MIHSFSEHKQHSHHDKSHMMMPGAPFSHLVISHAALAFRILKCTLNPKALALHPAQSLKCDVLRRIAQRYLYVRLLSQRLRCNQSPAFDPVRLPIPNIHLQTADFNPEHATGGPTQRHYFPTPCRERIQKVSHLNAFLVTLVLCKVAVGMPVTRHPPHRSQRAELPHWAPALGKDAQSLLWIGMSDFWVGEPPFDKYVAFAPS